MAPIVRTTTFALAREHDSRAVFVTQNNSLHARQRTAADPGFFTYRQELAKSLADFCLSAKSLPNHLRHFRLRL